jgi:hypothetical protein
MNMVMGTTISLTPLYVPLPLAILSVSQSFLAHPCAIMLELVGTH